MGHGRISDLALLWLWRRLAAAAPIGHLAWEHPCEALKRQKIKTKTKKKKREREN